MTNSRWTNGAGGAPHTPFWAFAAAVSPPNLEVGAPSPRWKASVLVYSRRTLGMVALIALATAAVSFAVVDVSTSIGSSCAQVGTNCAHEAVPIVAITSAALGFLALGIGVVPAVMWIVASVQSGRQSSDDVEREIARDHRRALRGDDGDLLSLPDDRRAADPHSLENPADRVDLDPRNAEVPPSVDEDSAPRRD